MSVGRHRNFIDVFNMRVGFQLAWSFLWGHVLRLVTTFLAANQFV